MTSISNKSMTMVEFARLLDVYGSERTRWPAEARASAAQLVVADPAARRLLAEREALDCVLNRAPLPGLGVEAALAERIVAAAQRSPRIVRLPSAQRVAEETSAEGSAHDGASRRSSAVHRVSAPAGAGRGGRRRLLSRQMGAAGVLAASLVVGVLIGSASSLPPQLVAALADMAGFTDRNDLVSIALSEEITL